MPGRRGQGLAHRAHAALQHVADPEVPAGLLHVDRPASVIDGDTIEVHGQRIRLHGIDAPESRQLCRLDGKAWQCGKYAANALAAALISLCLR